MVRAQSIYWSRQALDRLRVFITEKEELTNSVVSEVSAVKWIDPGALGALVCVGNFFLGDALTGAGSLPEPLLR